MTCEIAMISPHMKAKSLKIAHQPMDVLDETASVALISQSRRSVFS